MVVCVVVLVVVFVVVIIVIFVIVVVIFFIIIIVIIIIRKEVSIPHRSESRGGQKQSRNTAPPSAPKPQTFLKQVLLRNQNALIESFAQKHAFNIT